MAIFTGVPVYGSSSSRMRRLGALEVLPVEIFGEVFGCVPLECLIGAMRFVCRAFYECVDASVVIQRKQRVIEILGMRDEAVKLFCMRYCLGRYGRAYISLIDKRFIKEVMLIKLKFMLRWRGRGKSARSS